MEFGSGVYLSVFLPSKYTKSPACTQRAQVSLRREVLHRGQRSTATYSPSASSTDSSITQPCAEWAEAGSGGRSDGRAAEAGAGRAGPAEDAMLAALSAAPRRSACR